MAEERMELFIETLTGAAFELKVSPFETIVSIKAKIQYLEGIPVSQQHLIWRSQELLDDYCLHDYCITDGATLKLVLGMRGGPINTRQVPSENKKLKDLADYVEKRSETAASSGRPLTVLVFHDGDKVHMYTLLERGECSVTPLSGSISETSSISSTKNVDEEEDAQWRKENEQTREKMIKIQEQIKSLNLNKPKRRQKSPSGSVATTYSVKSSTLDTCGEQLKLPPLLQSSTAQSIAKPQRQAIRMNSENVDPKTDTIEKSVFSRWVAVTGSTAVIGNDEKWELEPGANDENYDVTADGAEKNPSASSSPKLKLNSISSPLLTLPEELAKTPEGECSPSALSVDKVSTPDAVLEKKSSFLPYLSPGQLQGAQNVDKKRFFNFSAQNASLIALGVNSMNSPYKIVKYGPSKHKDPYRHLSVTSNQALATQRFLDLDHWIDNRPKTTPQGGNLYRPLDSIVEGGVWGSIGSVHGHRPKKKGKSKHPLSISLPGSKLNPLTRLPENPDVRWNTKSSSNMLKNRTDVTRNHTKMGIGTLVASGTRVLKSSSTKVSSSASENVINPPLSPSNKTAIKTTKEGSRPNSGQKLPPVKTKKRTYKRCSWCNRRTGLATSYNCRCNKNFCAAHRYAELHHCTFDYKTEGRRLLQQNNPVVKAPKLPKI